MEDSILELLAKKMTGERFDEVVLGDEEYIKRNEAVAELVRRLGEYDLSQEERLMSDRLLTANNECNSRFSELAYIQGMKDSVAILNELDLVKGQTS